MKNTVSFSNGVATSDWYGKRGELDPSELPLYMELYGDSKISEAELKIRALVPNRGECGKQLEKGGIAWGCPACGKDATCVICQDCYNNSKHEGHHEYIKRGVEGGKCDCGDPDSWAISGSCPLHASGFTDETKLPPDILPQPLRSRAVQTLDKIMYELNSLCLKAEAELTPEEPVPGELNATQGRIVVLSRVLAHLSRVSPVFLHMIAVRFRAYSLRLMTGHKCHARRFDAAEDQKAFCDLCSLLGLTPSSFTGPIHPCSCTIIENYMRVHYSFPEKTRFFFNEQLFYILMRNRKLKHLMGVSYFANYDAIIPHACSQSYLTYLAVQFLGYDDVTESVLRNEECMQNLFDQLLRAVLLVKSAVKKHASISSALCYQLSHVCINFRYLSKRKYGPLFYPYLMRFIKLLGALHGIMLDSGEVYDNLEYKKLLERIRTVETILEDCFIHILGTIDLSDTTLCIQIVQAFQEARLALRAHPDFNPMVDHIIILHRCLSSFLVNFLVLNYWLDNQSGKGSNIRGLIRRLVPGKEEEGFARVWLPELLRAVGHFARAQAGERDDLREACGTSTAKAAIDFGLAAVLILCLRPEEGLLQWLLKAMHPAARDVAAWVDALGKRPITDGLWTEAAKAGGRSAERLQLVIEASFYTLCCWTSNDIMYCHMLTFTRKGLPIRSEVADRTAPVAAEYFQYVTARFIVLIYMMKSGKDGLSNDAIQSSCPESLRDVGTIEKCLAFLTSPYMDTKEHVMKFQLLDSSLRLFDPFLFFLLPSGQPSPFVLSALKRIQCPEQFDYFFGEFSQELAESKPTDKSGTLFVPFCELLRQTFEAAHVPDLALHFIGNSVGSVHVGPWMLGCIFKLALGCLKYCKNPARVCALKRAMAENVGRIILEQGQDEGLLFAYEKLLSEKLADKVALESMAMEEMVLLKRKASQDRKSRAKELQQKIREEFEARVVAFKNKNKMILSMTKSADPTQDSLICAYCRETVGCESYNTDPFGKVTYIQKSTIYGHHLNQILRDVLGKAWTEEQKFKNVVGRSQGAVLTSCGHYLHVKCMSQILRDPPDNVVCKIDSSYNQGTFLCPICQSCGNALVPPPDVVRKGNEEAVKEVTMHVLPRMRELLYPHEDPKAPEPTFLLLAKCLSYQLNMVDLNNVEDFIQKQDNLRALVFAVGIEARKNYYDEMIAYMAALLHSLRFLVRSRYRLFKADLTFVSCLLMLSASMMRTPECEPLVYDELRDKLIQIVKMAIIQISLRKLYTKVRPTAEAAELEKALRSPPVTETLQNVESLETQLVPFLKKLLCLKATLWPTPGRDSQADLQKAGWLLDDKNALEFYAQTLDLRQDIRRLFVGEKSTTKKLAYICLPLVTQVWAIKAWKSLLNHMQKEEEESGTPSTIPKALIGYDACCRQFQFQSLPASFDDLQRMTAKRSCKNCGKTVSDGAICLLCGELLCVAQPCCVRKYKGELTSHSKACPGGYGMYLRLINNKVVLVDGGHACNFPSPYVNKYGESVDVQKHRDQGPLLLEVRIVEDLKSMYLMHRVNQSVRTISLRSFNKFKPHAL